MGDRAITDVIVTVSAVQATTSIQARFTLAKWNSLSASLPDVVSLADAVESEPILSVQALRRVLAGVGVAWLAINLFTSVSNIRGWAEAVIR